MARTREFDLETVLNSAVDLFWQQGFYATSANDLVNHLGLSRSSLYDTFGDKRNLYLQALHQYRKQVIGKQLYLIETSTDLRETIETIFNLFLEQDLDAFNPKGCLLVNAATELAHTNEDVAAIVKGNQWDVQKAWEMAIKKAQEEGQLGASKNPISLAASIYNTMVGFRVGLKTAQEPATLEGVINETLHLLD